MSSYYIGLSTTGHDPAIAIVNDAGECIFAEATERYLQSKRAIGSPADIEQHIAPILHTICLNDPNAQFFLAQTWLKTEESKPAKEYREVLLNQRSVDRIAHVHKATQMSTGAALRFILGDRLALNEIQGFDHHLCHAVSAYYFSPYPDALCLVVDGEGETGAISVFEWHEGRVARKLRNWGPASLGAFYAWITELCGFSSIAGEEWKVMGLAAFSDPNEALVARLRSLFRVESGRLYFADITGLDEIKQEFLVYARDPSIAPDYMSSAELASSAQYVFTEVLNELIDSNLERFSPATNNIILTGGCALNSAFNGELITRRSTLNVHVPPAPGDDGNAIGAALLLRAKITQHDVFPHNNYLPYLGSQLNKKTLDKLPATLGLVNVNIIDDDSELINELVALLLKNSIIGIARGRAEFGPRALGNRSIIASPISSEMKDAINRKVKGREAYRPFAPMIPEEKVADWFIADARSPYMSAAISIHEEKRDRIPAVTHANGTGRVQTINKLYQPWLHKLLNEFELASGVPILLNTSFNIMGKPIIHSIEDAVATLMTTELDAVVLENLILTKKC